MADTIRVLRVIEFTGPRAAVEEQVHRSLHGEKKLHNGVVIRSATIGGYPEMLENLEQVCIGCAHHLHPGHQCDEYLLGGVRCGCRVGLPVESLHPNYPFPRCDSMRQGQQCILLAGHVGYHCEGNETWA